MLKTVFYIFIAVLSCVLITCLTLYLFGFNSSTELITHILQLALISVVFTICLTRHPVQI